MTDEHPNTDRSGPPTPAAWPVTGEPPPTDQPDPSEVLPSGNAPELNLLESEEQTEGES